MTQGFDDHPDIRDEAWIRKANKRARKDVRAMRRRARWRARSGLVVTLVLLLATGGLLYGLYRAGQFDGVATAPEPTPSTASFELDEEHPFANTPAANWADGDTGVVAPVAEPVGDFTAEQVAEGYDQVRHAIVTSRLDRKVVQDHDTSLVVGLFAPDLRDQMAQTFDGKHDKEASTIATRVAKGQKLLPIAPKVKGTMTAQAGKPGELVVRTSYLFAYAFETDLRAANAMEVIVVQRDDLDYVVRQGDTFREGSRGLWWGGSTGGGYTYSMACTASKEGFLAPSITERNFDPTATTNDTPPEAYFEPTHTISGPTCE